MSDETTTTDIPSNAEFLFRGSDNAEAPPQGEAQVQDEGAAGSDGPTDSEPATDATAAAQVQPPADDRQFKGVLNELRDTRRELRLQREEAARLRAEQEARIKQATAPKPPDKDEDPAAWLAYQNHLAVERLRQEFETKEQQRAYQEQSVQIRQQFFNTVTGLEEEQRAATPDYDDAVAFVGTLREQELSLMGVPEEEIPEIVKQERLQFVAMHLRNGQSPAQAAYQYALSRGFRGGVAAQATPTPQPGPKPQRPPQPPTVGRSLSAASGGTGGRRVTLENLTSFDSGTQNAIMDNEEAWATINQGGAWYV